MTKTPPALKESSQGPDFKLVFSLVSLAISRSFLCREQQTNQPPNHSTTLDNQQRSHQPTSQPRGTGPWSKLRTPQSLGAGLLGDFVIIVLNTETVFVS